MPLDVLDIDEQGYSEDESEISRALSDDEGVVPIAPISQSANIKNKVDPCIERSRNLDPLLSDSDGVVPILATKDEKQLNHRVNMKIAQVPDVFESNNQIHKVSVIERQLDAINEDKSGFSQRKSARPKDVENAQDQIKKPVESEGSGFEKSQSNKFSDTIFQKISQE
ncbi:hypothetical protein FBU30_007438 [Linnemannia zychae]|nr:hypothetical protein FBU30_007438 [Linnemannia zychae]